MTWNTRKVERGVERGVSFHQPPASLRATYGGDFAISRNHSTFFIAQQRRNIELPPMCPSCSSETNVQSQQAE